MGNKIIGAAILLVAPHLIFAQTPTDSWDNLRRLRSGQRIEVVDMKLKPVQGAFASYSEEALSMLVGGDLVSVPRANVFSVKNRQGPRRARNAWLGLAIGAAGGFAIGWARGATYHEAGETAVFMLAYTPIGAGIGAGVGAALPAGQVTVYRVKR